MGEMHIALDVRLAWWFKFYKFGLFATVFLTGMDPDWDKVNRVILRAVRIRVK